MPRLFSIGCLLLLAISTVGCGMQHAVEARHKLPKEISVAIVVNDPMQRLGDRRMSNMVAEVARRDLLEKTAVKSVKPTLEVERIRTDMGDEFDTLAIDALGRRLGVDQVINVYIESVDWQKTVDIIRPKAVARVKVVDVSESARTFPEGEVDRWADPGKITVEMKHANMDRDWRATLPLIQQELARQIGRTVGRLFYKYHPKDEL